MKSKKKKNRDLQKVKSRLGVSRKKNYTKESKVEISVPDNDTKQPANIPSTTYVNTETQNTAVTYPYLKRAVSYKHLRAHETKAKIVCRLLLEKKI